MLSGTMAYSDETVLELIRALKCQGKNSFSYQDIADAGNIPRITVERAVKRLKAQNLIILSGKGRGRGNGFFYEFA